MVLLSNTDFAAIGPLNQELVNSLMPHVDVPVVRGAMALAAAQAFLFALEKETVDRSSLAADFNDYLTPAKVAAAKAALNALGPISHVRVAGTSERGGLEVASILFDVGSTPARALMYRAPSGKIEEFLIARN